MKYRILHYIALGMALIAVSCSQSMRSDLEPIVSEEVEELPDGTPITITTQAFFPGEEAELRGIEEINQMWVVMFDKDHRYLYRVPVTIGAEVTPSALPTAIYPRESLAKGPGAIGVNGREGGKVRRLTFTILSSRSMEYKYMHFIANSNLNDESFPQDYILAGTDEAHFYGQYVFTSLTKGQQQPVVAFWAVDRLRRIGGYKVGDLVYNELQHDVDAGSFKGREYRLLRNVAKITVDNQVSGFSIESVELINAPSRGTVAPFVHTGMTAVTNAQHPFYTGQYYYLPFDPKVPTVLGGVELSNNRVSMAPGASKISFYTYEYDNSNRNASEQAAIIIRARRGNAAASYFKIALSMMDPATGLTTPIDIVRNQQYNITIQRVDANGYPTRDEAIANPAGNNIFAGVELQEYANISDGKYTLSVEHTTGLLTKTENTYTNRITFTDPEGNEYRNKVKVYYKGVECKKDLLGRGMSHPDGIKSAHYDPQTGLLHVTVSRVPTMQDIEPILYLNFVAVAKGDRLSKYPDHSPVPLQRMITLQVRPPYDFKARIQELGPTSNPQGEQVRVTFTVPGSLPRAVFPFPIRFEAPEMTPVDQNVRVVRNPKGGYYYEYIVSQEPINGNERELTLTLRRNRTNVASTITLKSDYYNDAPLSITGN